MYVVGNNALKEKQIPLKIATCDGRMPRFIDWPPVGGSDILSWEAIADDHVVHDISRSAAVRLTRLTTTNSA